MESLIEGWIGEEKEEMPDMQNKTQTQSWVRSSRLCLSCKKIQTDSSFEVIISGGEEGATSQETESASARLLMHMRISSFLGA